MPAETRPSAVMTYISTLESRLHKLGITALDRFVAWADRHPRAAMVAISPIGLLLWVGSCAVHLAWSIVEDVTEWRGRTR